MSGLPIGELHSLMTADGKYLFVPDEEVQFLTYGGYGLPPTQFVTRRGYRQHGVTEVDYLLEPRAVSVRLYHVGACSRQQYWDNRARLLEFLRPNRTGPLVLTLYQPDGAKRALSVRANPGLQFPPVGPDANAWNIDEQIEFIAFDPLWFDPDEEDHVLTGGYGSDLVFPATFPILFGPSGLQFTEDLAYAGTWRTYPVVEIDGPYRQATVQNVGAGVRLGLTVPIAYGEKRIIDLTPGAQRIVDGNGANRFGELAPDSNLVDWAIYPEPEVAGGVQQVLVTLVGTEGSAWYNEVQSGGPARFYRLGERTGAPFALDSGPMGKQGLFSGGVTLQQPSLLVDDPDYSAYFDGVDGQIIVPTWNVSNQSYSVEAWVLPDASPPVAQAIFGMFGAYAVGESMYLQLRDDGSVYHTHFFDDLQTGAGLVTFGDGPYHIVLTVDVPGNVRRIFVNAVLQAQNAVGAFTPQTPVTTIGADEAGLHPFQGIIDELLLYTYALSQTQVAAHYAARAGQFANQARLRYVTRYIGI